MLHEVLLALAGWVGDVFSDNSHSQQQSAKCYARPLKTTFPHLTAAERGVCDRLLKTASYYRFITTFVNDGLRSAVVHTSNAANNNNRNTSTTNSVNNHEKSLYFLALLHGIDKLLQDYRALLSSVERKVLDKRDLDTLGGATPLSYLAYVFAKYELIFPFLYHLVQDLMVIQGKSGNTRSKNAAASLESLASSSSFASTSSTSTTESTNINDISNQPLPSWTHNPAHHGTKIFALLQSHKSQYGGIPEVHACITLLWDYCSQVLEKQLVTFMVYGELMDPYGEFFVREVVEGIVGNDEDDEQPDYLTQAASKWQSRCTLDPSYIPPHISLQTASSILFVGKAVRTLRRSSSSSTSSVSSSNWLSLNEDVLKLVHSIQALSGKSTSEDHAEQDLDTRQLQLEITIQTIHERIASQLWEMIVAASSPSSPIITAASPDTSASNNIFHQLRVFRNYFLLGNGEFFKEFLRDMEDLRTKAASRFSMVTEHDLNNLLRRTIRKLSFVSDAEEKELLGFFRIKLLSNNANTSTTTTGANNNSTSNSKFVWPFTKEILDVPFGLEYTVSWPLDLVFGVDDLEMYNTLFSFLLYCRKTQDRLAKLLYIRHYSGKDADRFANASKNAHLQQLQRRMYFIRTMMANWVDSFWSFVQMDVVEVSFGRLIQTIENGSRVNANNDAEAGNSNGDGNANNGGATTADESTRHYPAPTLDQLIALHQQFLSTCVRGCFLETDSSSPNKSNSLWELIGRHIFAVLSICNEFCGLVERWVLDGAVMQSIDSTSSDTKAFENRLNELFTEFKSIVTFVFRTLSALKFSYNISTGNSSGSADSSGLPSKSTSSTSLASDEAALQAEQDMERRLRGLTLNMDGGVSHANGVEQVFGMELGQLLLRLDFNKWMSGLDE